MKKLSSTYLKLSVAPENGADATTYWLVPSTTQVKRKADGTHTPEYVSCAAMSKTGNGNPVAGIGTIKFTLTDKTGSSSTEFLYASRIIVTSDMASITFKQYVGGSVVDTKTVTVVDDGQNGGEGSPGPVGPLVYPAGKYDDSIPYTRTPLSAPMVLCEKLYYLLNKEGTFTGINPKEDYAANGKKGTWVYMEKVEFVFYEILMANFAKLASAVFFEDYMFSQQGQDNSGNDTIDFGLFDPSKIGQNNCPFTPNLMIDFAKGHIEANSGKFTGEINATSGVFSGYIKIPFKTFEEGAIRNPATGEYTVDGYFNLEAGGERTGEYSYVINLPTDKKYIGTVLNVYDFPFKTRSSAHVEIKGKIFHPENKTDWGLRITTKINMGRGGLIQFLAIPYDDNNSIWQVMSNSLSDSIWE